MMGKKRAERRRRVTMDIPVSWHGIFVEMAARRSLKIGRVVGFTEIMREMLGEHENMRDTIPQPVKS